MKSRQLDFEAIPDGTYLNSGRAAQQGMTINRFCYDLRHPANRDAFLADRDALMDRYGVAPEDRALIAAKDWLGMVRRGANVFPLLRLAQLCGDNLTATGAQMRGETIEQYLASRQTAGGKLTMGMIIGGMGSPHAPSIGALIDAGKWDEPDWLPLMQGYQPMQRWLAEHKPDAAVLIFNDHVTTFFFDMYPTFALSVAAEHRIADEGFGPRPLAPIPGDSDLAWHVAHSLVDDEFDITLCQDMPLDHGALTPISALWPDRSAAWPCPVLPIAVNVLQFPVPSPRRLFKLGQAIRRAVESYPDDSRVVVLGTGGLSHQLHGERFGYRNRSWDDEFLDLLERDPEQLASLRLQDYIERGGAEGAEVIMWLAMRGALSPTIRCVHRNYHAPLHTGFAQVIYEEPALA